MPGVQYSQRITYFTFVSSVYSETEAALDDGADSGPENGDIEREQELAV